MSEVIITIGEKEIRERYTEYVRRQAEAAPVSLFLNDPNFVELLQTEHLGENPRIRKNRTEIPVKIVVK